MSAFVMCDCGHKLLHHHGTSEGDAIQQPCLMEGCDCEDFFEDDNPDYELEVAPSGVGSKSDD